MSTAYSRLLLFILVFFVFLMPVYVWAQCNNIPYTISQRIGTVPLTVSIDGVNFNANNCPLGGFYNFTAVGNNVANVAQLNADRNGGSNDSVFTYTRPGSYNILIYTNPCSTTLFPNCNGVNFFRYDAVTVLDTAKPTLSVRACRAQNIQLSISGNPYDFYRIQWGDGVVSVTGNTNISHTYAAAGIQPLTVTGIYEYSVTGLGTAAGVTLQRFENSTILTTTVLGELERVNFTRLVVNEASPTNGTVDLTVNVPSALFTYPIQFRTINTPYSFLNQSVSSSVGQQQVVIGALNTQNSIYCFRILTQDQCGNSNATFTGTGAPIEICTLTLSGFADANANYATSGPFPESGLHTLSVNGVPVITNFLIAANETLGFTDTDVQCRIPYVYRSEVVFGGFPPERSSVSAPITVIALKPSTFAGLAGLNATHNNADKVELFWQPISTPGVKFYIYNEIAGAPNRAAADSTTANVWVPTRTTERCYYVQVKDACGESQLSRACPIKGTGQADNLVQNSLGWTTYENTDGETISSFIVEVYQDNGDTIRIMPAMGLNSHFHNPIDTHSQILVYRVVGVTNQGNVIRSNFIPVKQKMRVYMPNAFSPNNDGVNDVYAPKGLFWSQIEITIFNRFGQVVFYTNKLNEGWGGGEFNPDMYRYVVKARDPFGDEVVQRGTLMLVR